MNQSALSSIIAFIKLGRLKFVGGSLVMYALGISVALYEGYSIQLPVFWLGLVFIISSQLMTHYCNDYYDYEADCANSTPTAWSGGSRILPSGAVSLQAAFTASAVLGMVAFISAAGLFYLYDQSIVLLLLTAAILFISWFYSAPPFRLHSTGFGELAAALVVGVFWPFLAYFIQTQTISSVLLLAVFPVFILQFLMLVAIEFPDEAGDAQTGKRTFLIRISAPLTANISVALLVLFLIAVPFLVWAGLPFITGLAILIFLPLIAWQIYGFIRKDWQYARNWNGLAFRSVFLFAATGITEALSFFYLWLFQ